MRNTENLFDTRSNSQGLLIVKHHQHNYYEINTNTKVLSPYELEAIDSLFEMTRVFINYLLFTPNLSADQFLKLTSKVNGRFAAVVSKEVISKVDQSRPFTFFIHDQDPYLAMGEALKYICSNPILNNFIEEEDMQINQEPLDEFNQDEIEQLYEQLLLVESPQFENQTEENGLPFQ